MDDSLSGVRRFLEAVEELGLDYMLVGAFSVNVYGIPRSTKDADIVVSLRDGQLSSLMERLGPDYQLDRQMTFETITLSVRNVILYRPTTFKIEMFYLSEDPFAVERFGRRVRKDAPQFGMSVWVPTAEDVIVQKLRWHRPKDLIDAQDVLSVQHDRCDLDYVRKWTETHGTGHLLAGLLEETQSLEPDDETT